MAIRLAQAFVLIGLNNLDKRIKVLETDRMQPLVFEIQS